jgi:hypothetical protein
MLGLSWKVTFAAHVHSYKTEAAVDPLALHEFSGCTVVPECCGDASKIEE